MKGENIEDLVKNKDQQFSILKIIPFHKNAEFAKCFVSIQLPTLSGMSWDVLEKPELESVVVVVVVAAVAENSKDMSKPRGLRTVGKLKNHRREQGWNDKVFKNSHRGTRWKSSSFGGALHVKGKVFEKIGVEAKQSNFAITGFGRKGHAVGIFPEFFSRSSKLPVSPCWPSTKARRNDPDYKLIVTMFHIDALFDTDVNCC
ncbi:hypothetical protein HELRODRAFT_168431 [Helobdella robusta]|uniref:Uncharacterized protein n=1 Tax=Helobdella robusta TaxID=6412 RepID=T1F0L1_HELRO|nr:hypothetical protein HELRODRAFT_168431 [Helobdella robusta]ESO09447.1 hypothetical protein HELRODRAFT_168431 [Helobdella robusta]